MYVLVCVVQPQLCSAHGVLLLQDGKDGCMLQHLCLGLEVWAGGLSVRVGLMIYCDNIMNFGEGEQDGLVQREDF